MIDIFKKDICYEIQGFFLQEEIIKEDTFEKFLNENNDAFLMFVFDDKSFIYFFRSINAKDAEKVFINRSRGIDTYVNKYDINKYTGKFDFKIKDQQIVLTYLDLDVSEYRDLWGGCITSSIVDDILIQEEEVTKIAFEYKIKNFKDELLDFYRHLILDWKKSDLLYVHSKTR